MTAPDTHAARGTDETTGHEMTSADMTGAETTNADTTNADTTDVETAGADTVDNGIAADDAPGTGAAPVPRTVADADFSTLAEPFRPELLAHCYRMLGSLHDAEDLVQETYLRAWRGYDRFEGRSSVRRWLYKIATMTCLTALETRTRRPLPSGLGAPSDDHRVAVAADRRDIPWLQPAPDALFAPAPTPADTASGAADPGAIVAGRTGIRLAFIAALQHLPARQRAVLTLRDVLAFRTAETAEILGMTPAAVDSALRRARARLADAAPVEDEQAEPDEATRRRLLDAYVDAFTRADPAALVDLLRADVELEMPPTPTWFTGRDAVIGFLASRVLRPGLFRLVPTSANGQPAAAAYRRTPDGGYDAFDLQVLTLRGPRIARVTAFLDPGLVPAFGLAPTLTA
ncbi:sigma-70 family RNA polymerase sigma factor [Yinghuangia seranimata]|uniref:sigma-70 family RNA polymerase sigma factor n=1 Tax=Yinghuangia seranimata TaxID=408067 RepID=UPI00248B6979|nr:sigma-70 family RNA polymerase sigma factor [Yinghuangia seranimata]MDI2127755.1 sigma-70 family RNA polymerase sigma factor [Yinghuangia seranimata]